MLVRADSLSDHRSGKQVTREGHVIVPTCPSLAITADEDCALTAAQSARWEFAMLGWYKLLDGHRGSRLSERE